MTVSTLRQAYPEFVYQSATWKLKDGQLVAKFDYSANQHQFSHTVEIPAGKNQIETLDRALLDKLVFSLGMVELLSYWKAFCSPMIKIEAGALNKEQNDWWLQLLIEGMGEYFFVNQIGFTAPDFVTIVAGEQSKVSDESIVEETSSVKTHKTQGVHESLLIPVGGGKDSIVTIELLKYFQQKQKVEQVRLTALVVNPTQAALDVVAQSELPMLQVERKLDPLLLELNRQGFLNGHVPFSASLAFISVLTSYLHGLDAVVLSNEASANEASLSYLGRDINHQYSKSFAFETDFRWYINSLLPFESLRVTAPNYFSLLRPLNELQIGRLFAQYGQSYFGIFRSCNRGSKTNSWCNNCPKCLFAYLMLAPWLDESTMIGIFGQNLLDRADLLPVLQALIGVTPDKPLECVGLRQESLAACQLIANQYQQADKPLPALLAQIAPFEGGGHGDPSTELRVTPQSHGEALEPRHGEALEPYSNTLREPQGDSLNHTSSTNSLLCHWNSHHHLPPTFSEAFHHLVTSV